MTSPIDPALTAWLNQTCTFPIEGLREIPGDASFRRYFRLTSDKASYMVMDASQQRDCFESFLAVDQALFKLGVKVPEIMAHNQRQGYMLISDFGDTLYLHALNTKNADILYKRALDSLAMMQACNGVQSWNIPHFDHHFMLRELTEFHTWVLEKYLKLNLTSTELEMLRSTYHQLCASASAQTQVFIHRDYHSANLMLLPDNEVGVLDFQDACRGPVTYDLVSLLRDCYIDWPDAEVQAWVAYYYDLLCQDRMLQDVSLAQFKTWFDWMGMQRHLKAAFIFARKYLRDHTQRYLQYLPRTLNYVIKASALYPELREFHLFMSSLVLPVPEEVLLLAGSDQ